ncbi:MAG: sugar transferase [Patescibacteria group bacterium]
MAQISGRSNLDFDDEARLDISYIENWSPWLDLSIFIRTPITLLQKRKAV